jgi:hypothetical protein
MNVAKFVMSKARPASSTPELGHHRGGDPPFGLA